MYGDDQFGGDQFGGGGFDAGGGFGGGGGSQFAAAVPMQVGGSQGGGFQVDNSGPDGKAKNTRQNQSLIPVTIKQLKNAVAAPGGEQGFSIDGRDLHQVTFVGMILSADEQATNLQYTVEDGTDSIMVKMWIDSDADETMAERRAQWKEGKYVRVVGQLRAFNQVKNVVAYHISLITDFNEYTYHFIEAVHSHLKATKGPVANIPTGMHGAPMAPVVAPSVGGGAAPMAAAAQPVGGKDINQTVLEYFQSYGTSDEGCTIGQVAQATAASGISAEQVRAAVEYLAGEGHLYSTIDDEHYKSTGS
jgi:replication factor A2